MWKRTTNRDETLRKERRKQDPGCQAGSQRQSTCRPESEKRHNLPIYTLSPCLSLKSAGGTVPEIGLSSGFTQMGSQGACAVGHIARSSCPPLGMDSKLRAPWEEL